VILIPFVLPQSLAPLAFGATVCGPAAGLFLWWFFRDSRYYFARGALTFGIVAFIVSGACWTVSRAIS